VAAYALIQVLVVVYASQRYVTLWRWWRVARSAPPVLPAPGRWPRVTVQLPLYNEPRVVGRLIDAVVSLDYPRDRLEVQVLDDSTDETTGLARAAVERHRLGGVDIVLAHRARRDGYKAGALAAGLKRAAGELVAVFDADFVPDPDFLKRLVPNFEDPRVGMVQARWGHLNRERSLLTVAQAVMLDSHFILEPAVPMRSGLFFNFNGTAGGWRRSCIERSGGWTHGTLTEELDLSYRAQLQGWRFVFDPAVASPAELPADMEAFKSQQRRWAKGSIQTARKLLPRIMAARLPRRVKVEAFFHLTGNFAYPLLLALALLLLPVMAEVPRLPARLIGALDLAVIVTGVVPAGLFLAAGQRALGSSGWRTLRDVLAAIVVAAGVSANNATAVLEGLGERLGDWERTPKTGDRGRAAARPGPRGFPLRGGRQGWLELALAAYFATLTVVAWKHGHAQALPLILLLMTGFGYVGWSSLKSTSIPVEGAG